MSFTSCITWSTADNRVAGRSVVDRSVVDSLVVDRSVEDRSVVDHSVVDLSVVDRSGSGSQYVVHTNYGFTQLCVHTIKRYTPRMYRASTVESPSLPRPRMFDDLDDPLLQPASIFTSLPLSLSIQ